MTPVRVPVALILNVGRDPSLLDTRGMVLRSAGYLVESSASLADAVRRFTANDFDLVILCHSLREEERLGLMHVIREVGSSIPVISVDSNWEPHPRRNSSDSSTESDPASLLSHICEVLQRDRFAHAR